ncbi:hypothetical protein Lal_00011529 [Lupinus albus]|uniref:Putative cytochrome c oxidase, subunit III, 4-helical bundle n=1 Tax=Lupinus albus TaxID=3870 RepID=A0A6A4QCV3_LUPAL|nr:putative cytochrome c oxidase, subunit III, 4-helical bundle [Lupinus albus]KAF1880471.1 hypothetical protein Lal_00011529 [Lupinus albus]
MAVSGIVLFLLVALYLFAFIFAIGAEVRSSKAEVVSDEYDNRTYCVYTTDASTDYGLAAVVILILAQVVVNTVTRCLCCGNGLVSGGSSTCSVILYILSWVSFLGAEACFIAGSAKNAYHTKYIGDYLKHDLYSCATLRKGVFAAAAALTLFSMLASILYYWAHSRSGTGGWVKHHDDGLGLATQYQHQRGP